MSEFQGDQGRSETTPYGPDSASWAGQGGYGQRQYGAPDPYAQPQPYGGYDQTAAYQPGYQQGGYQPAGYGQPGGFGPAAPAKPGAVVTAAVFGFIFGAIGVLVTAGVLIGGIVLLAAGSGAAGLDQEIPGFDQFIGGALGAIAGVVVVIGLLALVWTVLAIWGSVWALTGRSRVMLIVAGSISIAATGLGLVGNITDSANSTAGSVVTSLVFFAVAVAIVVLLCLPASSQFFAAHRARRSR